MQTQAILSSLSVHHLTQKDVGDFHAAMSKFASDKSEYLAVYGQKFLNKYERYLKMRLNLEEMNDQWFAYNKSLLVKQAKLLKPFIIQYTDDAIIEKCIADLSTDNSPLLSWIDRRQNSDFMINLHNSHALNMRNADPRLKFYPEQLCMPLPELLPDKIMYHYAQVVFNRKKWGEANEYFSSAKDPNDDIISLRLSMAEEERFQLSQHSLVRTLYNFVLDAKSMHAYDHALSLLNTIISELQQINASFQEVHLNDFYHRELASLYLQQADQLVENDDAHEMVKAIPKALSYYRHGLSNTMQIRAQTEQDYIDQNLFNMAIADMLSALAFYSTRASDDGLVQYYCETIEKSQRAFIAYNRINFDLLTPVIKSQNHLEMAIVLRLRGQAELHNGRITASIHTFNEVLELLQRDEIIIDDTAKREKAITLRCKSRALKDYGKVIGDGGNRFEAIEYFNKAIFLLKTISSEEWQIEDQVEVASNYYHTAKIKSNYAFTPKEISEAMDAFDLAIAELKKILPEGDVELTRQGLAMCKNELNQLSARLVQRNTYRSMFGSSSPVNLPMQDATRELSNASPKQ